MREWRNIPGDGSVIDCVHIDEEGNRDPNHGQWFRGAGMLTAHLATILHAGHREWMGVHFNPGDADDEDCSELDLKIANIYQTFAYIGQDVDIKEYKDYENRAREQAESKTIRRRSAADRDRLLLEQFGWTGSAPEKKS